MNTKVAQTINLIGGIGAVGLGTTTMAFAFKDAKNNGVTPLNMTAAMAGGFMTGYHTVKTIQQIKAIRQYHKFEKTLKENGVDPDRIGGIMQGAADVAASVIKNSLSPAAAASD